MRKITTERPTRERQADSFDAKPPPKNEEGFLSTKESATYLCVSKSYLDKLRVYGGGPQFLRFGRRKILYPVADLNRWANAHQFRSTSEYGLTSEDKLGLWSNPEQQSASVGKK